MKKIVPDLIPIIVCNEPIPSEKKLLFRYNLIISEGYSFFSHDFYCYCSLLLRHNKKESIPNSILEFMYKEGELIPEIRFELIRFQTLNGEYINEDDSKFFLEQRRVNVEIRKKMIKKQITPFIKGKILNHINHINSEYYMKLLELTRDFTDITLLDWFTPIVLTYERLIHIFVKHVEETKFGDGSNKKRTYFTYKDTEIWILLKTIIRDIDTENIREHFIKNSVNRKLGRSELNKDYRRTSKNPIVFNGDKFVLSIDKNGFITQFYELIE